MKKRSKIKPFPDGKQRKRKERGQVLKYQFFPTSAPKREREKFMFQVFLTLQDTTANENRPCSQNDFKSRPDPKFPPILMCQQETSPQPSARICCKSSVVIVKGVLPKRCRNRSSRRWRTISCKANSRICRFFFTPVAAIASCSRFSSSSSVVLTGIASLSFWCMRRM